MPWWSWVVIWAVLVVVLLVVLVLGAVYLWRKLKALFKDVEDAQAELTPALADGVAVHAPASAASGLPVGMEALEAEPIEVRARLREEKQDRKDARRVRRIENLYRTGRPRRYGDLDHEPPVDTPR